MVSTAIRKARVLRVDLESGEKTFVKEPLAVEIPLSIYVNGRHYATLPATPSKIRELAVGHLIAEGVLRSISEIKRMNVKNSRVDIQLMKNLKASEIVRIKTPGGMAVKPDSGRFLRNRIEATKVVEMARRLCQESKTHQATRGVHFAAIIRPTGKIASFAEDVSRHSAVDKVVGNAALKKIRFSDCVLFTSCRLSASIVLKAARMGIPILASIAYPLESGVVVAKKMGLTLVHSGEKQLNIYTHPQRILTDLNEKSDNAL